MTKPPIDILLAVYNGERYLRSFLDSLLSQSCHDFRLIASNNRSTDATASILHEYSGRFLHCPLILPLPSELLSAQANFVRVTEAGDAAYIMYADGDDVWHHDKIEKTLAAMCSAENRFGPGEPILAHGDLRVVDENLRCLHQSFWRYQFIDPNRTALRQLVLQNCVTGCTTMLNRSLFELGRPIPDGACVHDHWYALIASTFGRIVGMSEPLIDYRQHTNNVTGAKRWGPTYVVSRAMRLYGRDGARETLARNGMQAKEFLWRFGTRLNAEQKGMLEDFVALQSQGALNRRRTLVRNRFWKAGFVRNVGLLMAI